MRRLLGVAVCLLMVAAPCSAAAAPPTNLQQEKLRQEIRQLRLANDEAQSARHQILEWAPFITVLVAVGGLAWPVLREVREQRRQRALDREQRERELAQQRLEAQRRFHELFAEAVANLGAEQESVQVSAVVALQSFLDAEYAPFHEQVYQVVRANLAVDHSRLVNRFLVQAFAQAIRQKLTLDGAEPLDLAGCAMPRIDLSETDLTGVDLAFVTLDHANLRRACLFRVRGIQLSLNDATLSGADLGEARIHGVAAARARFHDARLVAAELRPAKGQAADLHGAEFFGAKLQGAHFDGADLRGARFDSAHLADAYFVGAQFDTEALRSILRSAATGSEASWRRAHFDPDVREELERLDARRSRPRATVGS